MTTTPHTLQEKTTAMEKAIRMAKEVHEPPIRVNYATTSMVDNTPTTKAPSPKTLITTAKQIYDWLTA